MRRILVTIFRLFCNPKIRFSYLTELGFTRFMSDEKFVKKEYQLAMGRKLDIEKPCTYNEKLQWLKLYDRNPLYAVLVDKYEAKKYVGAIIGEEYIIPTLGVWNNFDEINFDLLPEQFVLKCTHDSGGVVICKSKSEFDVKNARKKINKCLKRNYFYAHREWPYKNVKPRIIAEKYMEDEKTQELRDYKFFVFNGEAKMLFIAKDRQVKGEETKFDFFDMEFNHLHFKNGHPNSEDSPKKPCLFEEMKLLAEKLAKGLVHVRVDFYEVNGKIYWGELTFSHWSGLVPFEPEEWDYRIGEWLKLPN